MAQLHYGDQEARSELLDSDYDNTINVQGEGYGVIDPQDKRSESPPRPRSEAPLPVHHMRSNPFTAAKQSPADSYGNLDAQLNAPGKVSPPSGNGNFAEKQGDTPAGIYGSLDAHLDAPEKVPPPSGYGNLAEKQENAGGALPGGGYGELSNHAAAERSDKGYTSLGIKESQDENNAESSPEVHSEEVNSMKEGEASAPLRESIGKELEDRPGTEEGIIDVQSLKNGTGEGIIDVQSLKNVSSMKEGEASAALRESIGKVLEDRPGTGEGIIDVQSLKNDYMDFSKQEPPISDDTAQASHIEDKPPREVASTSPSKQDSPPVDSCLEEDSIDGQQEKKSYMDLSKQELPISDDTMPASYIKDGFPSDSKKELPISDDTMPASHIEDGPDREVASISPPKQDYSPVDSSLREDPIGDQLEKSNMDFSKQELPISDGTTQASQIEDESPEEVASIRPSKQDFPPVISSSREEPIDHQQEKKSFMDISKQELPISEDTMQASHIKDESPRDVASISPPKQDSPLTDSCSREDPMDGQQDNKSNVDIAKQGLLISDATMQASRMEDESPSEVAIISPPMQDSPPVDFPKQGLPISDDTMQVSHFEDEPPREVASISPSMQDSPPVTSCSREAPIDDQQEKTSGMDISKQELPISDDTMQAPDIRDESPKEVASISPPSQDSPPVVSCPREVPIDDQQEKKSDMDSSKQELPISDDTMQVPDIREEFPKEVSSISPPTQDSPPEVSCLREVPIDDQQEKKSDVDFSKQEHLISDDTMQAPDIKDESLEEVASISPPTQDSPPEVSCSREVPIDDQQEKKFDVDFSKQERPISDDTTQAPDIKDESPKEVASISPPMQDSPPEVSCSREVPIDDQQEEKSDVDFSKQERPISDDTMQAPDIKDESPKEVASINPPMHDSPLEVSCLREVPIDDQPEKKSDVDFSKQERPISDDTVQASDIKDESAREVAFTSPSMVDSPPVAPHSREVPIDDQQEKKTDLKQEFPISDDTMQASHIKDEFPREVDSISPSMQDSDQQEKKSDMDLSKQKLPITDDATQAPHIKDESPRVVDSTSLSMQDSPPVISCSREVPIDDHQEKKSDMDISQQELPSSDDAMQASHTKDESPREVTSISPALQDSPAAISCSREVPIDDQQERKSDIDFSKQELPINDDTVQAPHIEEEPPRDSSPVISCSREAPINDQQENKSDMDFSKQELPTSEDTMQASHIKDESAKEVASLGPSMQDSSPVTSCLRVVPLDDQQEKKSSLSDPKEDYAIDDPLQESPIDDPAKREAPIDDPSQDSLIGDSNNPRREEAVEATELQSSFDVAKQAQEEAGGSESNDPKQEGSAEAAELQASVDDGKQSQERAWPTDDVMHGCETFQSDDGVEKIKAEGYNIYTGEPENVVYNAADVLGDQHEKSMDEVRDSYDAMMPGQISSIQESSSPEVGSLDVLRKGSGLDSTESNVQTSDGDSKEHGEHEASIGQCLSSAVEQDTGLKFDSVDRDGDGAGGRHWNAENVTTDGKLPYSAIEDDAGLEVAAKASRAENVTPDGKAPDSAIEDDAGLEVDAKASRAENVTPDGKAPNSAIEEDVGLEVDGKDARQQDAKLKADSEDNALELLGNQHEKSMDKEHNEDEVMKPIEISSAQESPSPDVGTLDALKKVSGFDIAEKNVQPRDVDGMEHEEPVKEPGSSIVEQATGLKLDSEDRDRDASGRPQNVENVTTDEKSLYPAVGKDAGLGVDVKDSRKGEAGFQADSEDRNEDVKGRENVPRNNVPRDNEESPYTDFDGKDDYVKVGYGGEGFLPKQNENVERELRDTSERVDQGKGRQPAAEHPLDVPPVLDSKEEDGEYVKIPERPSSLPHPQPADMRPEAAALNNKESRPATINRDAGQRDEQQDLQEEPPHKKGVLEKIKDKLHLHSSH